MGSTTSLGSNIVSRGRGRSWRPERKSAGRKSRRRTIILLIAALVGLVGLLIIPTIPPNASFRTALILPQSDALPNTAFSMNRSASLAIGAKRLQQLFEDLHKRNPRQVGEVTSVGQLSDVSSSAKPDEKLLLYCGLEPLIADNDGPEIQLWDGAEVRIAFPKLLKELGKLQASQVILVMDFLQRDTGIANGRLSDDIIPLMKASVTAAKMRELVVVFPCESNQRNWESLGPVPAKEEASTDSGNAPPARNESIELGSVLTASLLEAFQEGHYASVDELYDALRENVSDRVRTQYGQTQTVQLYPENSPLRDWELLVRAERPSLDEDAEEGLEAPSTEDDTSTVEAVAETAKTTDGKPTPSDDLASLIAQRDNLARTGEAVATNPVEWTQLAVALSSARLDLIHGHNDSAHFDIALSAANTLVNKIAFDLKQVANAKSKVSFAPWLTLSSPGDLAAPTDRLRQFEDAFAKLKQEQVTAGLPFEFRLPETRVQFTNWIVGEIGELHKTIEVNAEGQQQHQKLLEWQRFMTHLPVSDWAKSDWSEPLFTIDEILSQPIVEQPVERVRALQSLLRLRQRALECTTGTFRDNSRFRQSVWLDASTELQGLLIELTAAERWLALGPEGLTKSQQKLEAAESNWSDVHRRLKSQHAISVLPDLQQTEIPFLIQFLAQQQEEVAITLEELNVAVSVADNILAGQEVEYDQFSPGTHGRTGLSSTEIQAMFQLTRNLNSKPASEQDLLHLATLNKYIADRFSAKPIGLETQRLVSLVTTERSIEECHADLRRSAGDDTNPNQGRTGLRLSSWSIRLLDSVSGTPHQNLWVLWKSLANALRNDDANVTVTARTKLAVEITMAWTKFRSQPERTSAADLFVTQEMASRLLADDLAQRINARTSNSKFYQQFYNDKLTNVPPLLTANEQLQQADAETQVGADNTAVVKLKANAASVYIQDRAFQPTRESFRQLGWYRLDDPRQISELTLSATNSAATTQVLKLAFTNQHDVIFASQDLTVFPNAEAEWEISADLAGRPIVLRDGRDLKLPPSTLSPKGKDTPISLNLRLRKISGAASLANVELFAIGIDGTELSLGIRPIEFSQSDSSLIPFAAATPADGSAVPNVNSNAPVQEGGADVRGGIRLEVTPDIRGANSTSITLRPLIADAAEYVQPPQVDYDATQQQLTIVVNKKQNVASLAPKSLPLEIHFNPLLSELLKRDESSPTRMAKLQDGRNQFGFVFSDELRSSLSGTDALEFSMSVAGIPHAWRWRLNDDGATLIAPDEPIVRTDLSLQNPAAVREFSTGGSLLLGADWKKAKLDVQMHLHGGQFGSRQFEAEHELRLNIVRQDSNQPPVTVFGAVDVFTSRPESIRVSPGENGAWNFSTQTSSYEKLGLQINEESSLGAGKYELVAELRTLASNRRVRHRREFVFDDTAPDFSEDDIQIKFAPQVGRPIVGRVVVADSESTVTEVRIGFDKSSLRKFTPNAEFTLPASSPGIPKLQPTSQFQSEAATLIVTAINEAGLEKTVTKEIKFTQDAMTASASKPKAMGSVEFTYNSTRSWTATLKNGSGFSKTQTAGSPMLFDDVPVGTYTIFWKTGVGAKSGTTPSFSVKNGETAEVSGP